jgi:sugar/nucleoside kinase (ribokinase family)
MAAHGLFVGLLTLDLIYQVEHLPHANEKLVATAQTTAAGGPATNAAVTYRHLGNEAKILGILGSHPLSQLVTTDLQQQQVSLTDLQSSYAAPPPLSSILVTQATGDRAVVSRNAEKRQATLDQIPANALQDVEIVLIDGHQMAVGYAIARHAKAKKIPIVIDGGSWKSGFEEVLPFADYVICSANFFPPGCDTAEQVFTYLQQLGIPHVAITNGNRPIAYQQPQCDRALLSVPEIEAVDTLGAGDIFHGAFCHFIRHQPFGAALQSAADIAAQSCQFFGTREWLSTLGHTAQ